MQCPIVTAAAWAGDHVVVALVGESGSKELLRAVFADALLITAVSGGTLMVNHLPLFASPNGCTGLALMRECPWKSQPFQHSCSC